MSTAPDRAAVVGHEIRGPLGVALTLTEMLLSRDLADADRRLVELIRLAGQHALAVAEDLVAEASLAADGLRLAPSAFDPSELVATVAGLWSPLGEQAGRRVEAATAHGAPATVVADPGRVRQILFNLVANAMRHAPDGTVRIEVAPAPEGIAFSVRDHGGGGAAPAVPRAFAPGDATPAPGAGLGLWISGRLAAALGGRLEIGPAGDGPGTDARLVLPLAPADAPRPAEGSPTAARRPARPRRPRPPARSAAAPPPRAGAGAAKGPASPLAGLDALVVDDSTVSRMLMTAILTSFGMTVSTVGTGRDAETVLAARRPDVILTDWSLPGETAADLVARLADRHGDVLPPVLTVSAASRLPCTAHVAGHVAKPFSPRELYDALSTALSGTRAAATAG